MRLSTPFILFSIALIAECTVFSPRNLRVKLKETYLSSVRNTFITHCKHVLSVGVICSSFDVLFPPMPVQAVTQESTLSEVWNIVNENYFDESYNGNDWSRIKALYEKKLTQGADETTLVKDMLSKLGDKYTRLLDKKLFESLWKYDAIGVGLLFQTDPGKPMVVASQPISGSSGFEAGLEKGDIVYAINGESTEKMTALDLLDRMSNDDSNTITIVYGKKGQSVNQKNEIVLKRSLEKAVNPVTHKIEKLNDGRIVGYARIGEFNAQAVNGLEAALKDISAAGAEELVLDLRGNTGGGFQFALNVGGMFMKKETVMASTKARNNENTVFKTSYDPGVMWTKPIILLTDELSASASEVLAGGLHDNCRAVLVGEKTFGKGKIQAVFGLQDGEGLTMTVAQYVTPKGTVIQSKGLQPDIATPVTNAYLNLVLGNIAPAPDLKTINYQRADDVMKACVPPS